MNTKITQRCFIILCIITFNLMHIQQAFKLRQLFVVKHNVDILISYRDKNFTGITLIYVPRFPFFTIYLHYVFHKILVL